MGRLTEDMKRVVSEQKLGFAATVGEDGTPNLPPKGTFLVLDDEHIVKLRVERAVPVVSPAYDIGADEAELRETWMTHFAGLQSK